MPWFGPLGGTIALEYMIQLPICMVHVKCLGKLWGV
jgi:hypothetical protein